MSTTAASPAAAAELGMLREQALVIQRIIRLNTGGLTHEDSLVQPQPGGNCLNWVLGHLLAVYESVLPVLGQQPVIGKDKLQQYDRGSEGLRDPSHALPMAELLNALDEAAKRVDAGLASLPPERLDSPLRSRRARIRMRLCARCSRSSSFIRRTTAAKPAFCAASPANQAR